MSIFIDIHTHSIGCDRSLYSYSIGRDAGPPPEGTLFSAGIHPWSAANVDTAQALDYLRTTHLAAIGEVGLDYASSVDRQKQKQVFEAQLGIAEKCALPVIIHCVRAHNELLSILEKYKLRAVIFHGYTGSLEQTAMICDAGYYFSFGARSLRSPKTMQSLRRIPLDRIFAETDESDLLITYVYTTLAERLNITVEELKIQIERNFKHIFG